jgi:glycosyltransferase involved in cell wall biosynthesis
MAVAPRTGTGRYTLEILKHLGRVADGKAEFVLIGPRTSDELGLAGLLPVVQHVHAGPETLLNPAWEQFGSVSAFAGCDIVFAPTGILASARTCPGVAVIHDLGFLDRPADFEPHLSAHLTRWVRRTCLSAERLIAVSGFTKSRIVRHYGVDPERIGVVHHGGPPDFGEEPKPESMPVILCVAAFEPNKNLLFLVEAFKESGLADEARLVLAGREGRSLGQLRARVRELDLTRAVEIETSADDARLRDLYRTASAFAYPSLYEGFGMPLVEAMSARLPLIASRIPASLEVAGNAAILLDPDDRAAWARALGDVIRDSGHRVRLAEESRKRGTRYDWSVTARQTWDALLVAVRR